MKLVTGNQNKIKEWNALMKMDHVKLDLIEIQGTMDEIIKYKCETAFQQLKEPCVVEDVGLSFDGMNGLPGPYIKSFLAMGLDQISKLRHLGDGTAEAICMIGYHDGTDIFIFKGVCRGKLVEPRGTGFGWDPIFQVNGKTFAELSSEEKNNISHRSKAVLAFKEFLNKS